VRVGLKGSLLSCGALKKDSLLNLRAASFKRLLGGGQTLPREDDPRDGCRNEISGLRYQPRRKLADGPGQFHRKYGNGVTGQNCGASSRILRSGATCPEPTMTRIRRTAGVRIRDKLCTMLILRSYHLARN